ncbi:N-acetylmuramoyl-L-alanine amidase [Alkalibacterium subtropicum]|uniref:N-acetylmuramoyl-L-alanine amidase n=1 Tax=Alkalibacterium subtropicum TaxID=753702 RepID=A0A1I1EXG0_9LACT|nr:N-acetylmuramoyl-L-alanine amidase [Alkalibacterium subtropicum]SFB91342.1 N-acetylmuramoyl-L-alanine amidase [Alkalibacterium subtropicum]
MDQSHLHSKNNRSLFILLITGLVVLLLGSIVALANENKVTVLASTLNVRYGPGLSHEILTQVNEQEQLNVLGEENEWYKVRLETDQIGWVASWLVENEEVSLDNQLYGRITSAEVNVRQFSTTDSKILGTVSQGEEFPILYREDDWVQILFNHRVAWLHADLIAVIDQPTERAAAGEKADASLKIRVGSTPTNIRHEPTIDAGILTTLRSAEEFDVLKEENEWYEIELSDGTRGFVASWVTETVSAETVSAKETLPNASASHYATTLAEATIVIDPGHGGYDPGAVASSGFTEKEVTLNTGLLLADRLKKDGVNVILTRSTDEYISLNDRVYYAHQANADAFISLHYDAVPEANSMSGTTTYYYSDNERSLADVINQQLSQNVRLDNNGVRHGNYQVLRQNAQPSVLLELGYMNNDYDITLVNTPAYQSTVADAVYNALDQYFSQR